MLHAALQTNFWQLQLHAAKELSAKPNAAA
jgi:hypothetical protein